MPERGFFIFWIFWLFFGNFLARAENERNSGLKFFSLFLGLSHPVSAKNNAGKRFFNLLNFCYFFRNCLARVEYERNSGLKFFSRFLGLSHPVSAKTNAGMRFFCFLIFFAIIFGIFLPGSSMNGIRDQNFFLSFSANLIPYWLKIIPEIGFLIFWIFLLLFSEFSCSGRVGTEFRTKNFFSLSRPISSRFG